MSVKLILHTVCSVKYSEMRMKERSCISLPLLLIGCSSTFVFVYRCSLMGFDLNRHWQDPSPWAHPTLHAVKQLIVQMNQDPVSAQSHTHAQARTSTHILLRSSCVCWSQEQFSFSLLGSACFSNLCLGCVLSGAWIG